MIPTGTRWHGMARRSPSIGDIPSVITITVLITTVTGDMVDTGTAGVDTTPVITMATGMVTGTATIMEAGITAVDTMEAATTVAPDAIHPGAHVEPFALP